jgi:hypothetical protein
MMRRRPSKANDIAEMTLITAEWANFLAAEVGASATLTGLVVVAISINLARILSFAHLPGRAAEALVTLVGALVLSSVWLMPNQPTALLGAEALMIGLVSFLVPLVIQLQALNAVTAMSALQKYARGLMNMATSLLFVAAGILLIVGSGVGLYFAGAGVIVSLIAGVWNAWVLLVEILR